ncbi:MAG: tetratricopeptide repeat protein, partial [Gemmatimonadetes bacterium]|nr:tetratricopeptide repeat protein [Gemmatimonadota bacterium]
IESARLEGRTAAIAESFGDRSIAVLPFADMSRDGDQEYFSDGISEELLNLLARIPELRVISRSSAFSFRDQNLRIPEIAGRLEVAYILEGSVRKSGDLLRITAQLIEGPTDTHLWSETYDRPLENIFLVQDEIATAVVEQIKGTLQISVPSQTVRDPDAYNLLLQGRHVRDQGTRESYDSAIELFRGALELDPGYTEAWDALANIYQNQAVIGLRPADEGFKLAREASLAALAIDPDYAPAHATLGWGAMYHEGDPALAVGHYQRAMELDPTNPFILGAAGILLQNLGHFERGLEPIEYMVARDPVYSSGHYILGLAYIDAGRFDEAVSSLRRALTLSPGFTSAQYAIGVAQLLDGEPNLARSAFEAESNEAWQMVGLSLIDDSALSRLIAEYGDSWAYNIAYVFAYRGEEDAAFEWLERAVGIKDPGLGEITSESLFANITEDPRWVPFLETLGKSPDLLSSIDFRVTIPR